MQTLRKIELVVHFSLDQQQNKYSCTRYLGHVTRMRYQQRIKECREDAMSMFSMQTNTPSPFGEVLACCWSGKKFPPVAEIRTRNYNYLNSKQRYHPDNTIIRLYVHNMCMYICSYESRHILIIQVAEYKINNFSEFTSGSGRKQHRADDDDDEFHC